MLFSFYPFRIEEYLKSPPITGTYFEKLQETGLLDVINRNRPMMEPFIESYTTPALIPDDDVNCKKRSLNYEQRKIFDIVQGWAKRYVKSK